MCQESFVGLGNWELSQDYLGKIYVFKVVDNEKMMYTYVSFMLVMSAGLQRIADLFLNLTFVKEYILRAGTHKQYQEKNAISTYAGHAD